MSTGASVAVHGVVVESPGKGQRFEVKAREASGLILLVSKCVFMNAVPSCL